MLAEGLVTLLLADSGVSQILATRPAPADGSPPGTGIFPLQSPEGAPLPLIVFTEIHAENEMTLDGPDPFTMSRMEFSCRAAKYTDAKHLARAVRQALEGFTGSLSDPDDCQIDSMHRVSEIDLFEFAPFDYRTAVDVAIAYRDQQTFIIPPGIGGDVSLPNYDSGTVLMPTVLTAITPKTTKVWRIILVNVTNQAQTIVALTDGNSDPYLEPDFTLAAGETLPIDFGGATFANGVEVQAQNPNAIRIQVVGWQ